MSSLTQEKNYCNVRVPGIHNHPGVISPSEYDYDDDSDWKTILWKITVNGTADPSVTAFFVEYRQLSITLTNFTD